jgi:hypothetical protein
VAARRPCIPEAHAVVGQRRLTRPTHHAFASHPTSQWSSGLSSSGDAPSSAPSPIALARSRVHWLIGRDVSAFRCHSQVTDTESPNMRGSVAKSNPAMVICVTQYERIACGLMATVGRGDLSDRPEGQGG